MPLAAPSIPALLRGKSSAALPSILVILLFGPLYGAVMGAYPGEAGIRPVQMLYSGLKVPLLLLATFLISIPSFFVLNTLLGVREDFARAVRALLATQACLTVVLASFAPITALWYCCFADYGSAILFNAVMFGLASLSAQFFVRKLYHPLIQKNPRHRSLLRGWLLIYAFVGIQMGWLLRPFIGAPVGPTTFFREDKWGNAYLFIIKLVTGLRAGG